MSDPTSKIVITNSFDTLYDQLVSECSDARIIRIEADDFLIEHAKEAMEHAYLTSDRKRILLLCAHRFTPIAQNKLLKILEEPPEGTSFVLATPGKSALLATIRSRLPVEQWESERVKEVSGIDLATFDLATLDDLLRTHRRSDAKTVRSLIEALGREAARSDSVAMDGRLVEVFEESVRLLDVGSPPSFVLGRLGLKLLESRR